MIIGVDFDGTIVKHEFPQIGELIPNAIETLQKWIAQGHQIIIWTCREGRYLYEARWFLQEHGLKGDILYNENAKLVKEGWGLNSRKVYADFYIDDRNLGIKIDWLLFDKQIQERANG